MQSLVRNIIQSILFEKKSPSIEELTKLEVRIPEKPLPTFVTIYDKDVIVASSGRLYALKETFLEELIDNTNEAIKDPRFESYKNNPESTRNLTYRVDTFDDKSRRMLRHPDDIDPKTEGMILICRKQKKVWTILPHMLPETLSGEEIYRTLAKKINLDIKSIGKWDLILYALKTHIFSDSENWTEKV